jgi:hypothetical protein
MALPIDRESFKQYCLRRVGAPVTQINVDEDQIQDRIDDALNIYWDVHFDGTEKQYYKALIDATAVANKYITLPDNIIGAVNIFPIGSSLSTNNLFNIRYQIALNDLYDLTATTMVPYYMAMQHIQLLEELLVGQQPIRYNRRSNRLYIDMDWNKAPVGTYILVEAFQIVDPEVYPNVWKDRWLLEYATQLIKKQWGDNLIKYTGVSLPGGMQFNGQKIYDDAAAEVRRMEDQMLRGFSAPIQMFMG